MELVARYRLSLALVLVALTATGGFLLFGLPRVPAQDEAGQRVVALAHVRHYSPAFVRRIFAVHGIDLRYSSAPGIDPMWLTVTRLPATESTLYVNIVRRAKSVSWGPKPANEYDQPVGNLLVHYGGHDAATLAKVEAAVAALAR